MSRRPSAVSTVSQAPSLENGHVLTPARSQVSLPTTRKNSVAWSVKSGQPSTDFLSLDPDDLFAKHTISEVKSTRQRLRDEADAKQGELRLMVGERYRDLLQASTSIISISHSSKRVLEAIEEVQGIIVAQGQAPAPKRVSLTGKNDAHLHTLQILSAHVKLLLDTPEHLWRLIERKQYYSAAWLFLLARIVHRALISDEQDEQTWNSQGLDVLEQFPLVQRQWDAVSQFRSQIIHKATMSFREHEVSIEENCATLLTLHLLDTRPLSDALSIFLAQRSKALHTMFSWKSGHGDVTKSKHSSLLPGQANGHPPGKMGSFGKQQMTFRRTALREVKNAILAALGVIFRTLTTARGIFQQNPNTLQSMMSSALEYIQSDLPSPSPSRSIPPQILVNTESLLATLPSSTHFLLLPLNLRSYKPYIDPSSSASCVPQAQLSQKLDEWFRKSTDLLQNVITSWLSDLQSVREVWNVRSSVLEFINSTPDLDQKESSALKLALDDAYLERLLKIWKDKLKAVGESFRDRVVSVASLLANGDQTKLADIDTVEYLFEAPPLPTFPQNNLASVSVDASVQKYKATLQRQLMGRTSPVNEVLNILEDCGRVLRQDFSRISSDDDESARLLLEKFKEGYRSGAKVLCADVIHSLKSAADTHLEETENVIHSLVFIGRVADELASSSSFASSIECDGDVMVDFRCNTRTLCDQLVDRWREYIVTKVVREHWYSPRPPSGSLVIPNAFEGSSTPTLGLMSSLLSLSTSIQHLGVYREPSRQRQDIERTLCHFIVELIKNDLSEGAVHRQLANSPSRSDLAVLRNMIDRWNSGSPGWIEVSELLDKKMASAREVTYSNGSDLNNDPDNDASEYLARTQVLFSTLLPNPLGDRETPSEVNEKPTTLLPLGIPVVEKDYHPAFRIAKPLSRFGLVLVGNETIQY